MRQLKRFNVGEDCPVFDGLYSFCQTYAGMLLAAGAMRQELLLESKLMTKFQSMSIMNILVQIMPFMLPQVTWKTKILDLYSIVSDLSYLRISQSCNMLPVLNFRKHHKYLKTNRVQRE